MSRKNIPNTADLISEWLVRYKPSTASQYATEVRRLMRRSRDTSLLSIRPSHIRAELDLATTSRTCQRAYSALCGFFDYANQKDVVKSNPVRSISLRELLSARSNTESAIRALLQREGLSKKEISEVRWSDVLRLLLGTASTRDGTISQRGALRISAQTQKVLANRLWVMLRRTRPDDWISKVRNRILDG